MKIFTDKILKTLSGSFTSFQTLFLLLVLLASSSNLGTIADKKTSDMVSLARGSVTEEKIVTEVYFPSATNKLLDPVVAEVEAAKGQIWIIGAAIESLPLSTALYQAHKRGVVINCLISKNTEVAYFMGQPQSSYVMLPFVTNYVDDQQEVHTNVMVIDAKDIMIGDFASPVGYIPFSLIACAIIKNAPITAQSYINEAAKRLQYSHLSYLNTLLAKRTQVEQEEKAVGYFVSLKTILDLLRVSAARSQRQPPGVISFPLTLPKLRLPSAIDPALLPQRQVVVSWIVDEFGLVKNLKVVTSCGNPIVDQEALDTVQTHRFRVTWGDHGPVPVAETYAFDLSEVAAK